MDVHLNRYYNIPLCFNLIIFGCLAAFSIAMVFNLSLKSFRFIGQNTLVFYIWHPYAKTITDTFLKKLGYEDLSLVVPSIISVVSICIICSLLSIGLNALLPECVGKKSHKASK